MLRRFGFVSLLFLTSLLSAFCRSTPQSPATAVGAEQELKLWSQASPDKRGGDQPRILVDPGSESEALDYYNQIRANFRQFPKQTLADSAIEDMLGYVGFSAIPAAALEALPPDDVMDYERLRRAIATPEFEAEYRSKPLAADEILVSRFFAPKIVNVRDPQVDGVPKDGFGWRKVLRFRARNGSHARGDGLDSLYLLFNFTSGSDIAFPENVHAGQIQAILVPTYPTNGKHRDAYFFVYQGLGTSTPGKVGLFLQATFDLQGTVSQDDKYYVPQACGQCHGTELTNQKRAKVNYLDTDHWIDRTGDDFKKVPSDNVLVDGEASYATFRKLNRDIEAQNAAVLKESGGQPFALLAAQKWLALHKEHSPDATRHVPAIHRGFVENAQDPVWTPGMSVDEELLPLLNQYCFRCHSSVRYHVFQKQVVLRRKDRLVEKINTGEMPQDRTLDQPTKDRLIALLNQLK